MNAPIQIPPSPRLVELARAIDRRSDQSALDFSLAVGHMIIQGIFGGNLAAWRTRGDRDLSFRKLARMTQVSASRLYRSAAIYEMSCRMDVRKWGLTVSHLRAVIGLSHTDQHRLLTLSRREGWTVRRLEQICSEHRQRQRIRPVGRPPSPALLKGLSRLNRAIALTDQAPITLDSLRPDQRRLALARLDEQMVRLSEIRGRLKALTSDVL